MDHSPLTPWKYWGSTLGGPVVLFFLYGSGGELSISPLSFLASLLLFLPLGQLFWRLNEKGRLDQSLGCLPLLLVILLLIPVAAVETAFHYVGPWLRGWLFFPEFLCWSLLTLAYSHYRRQKEEGESSDPPSPNTP